MIMTALLRPGTLLSNVRWAWIAAGVLGATQTTGITQPDSGHPIFRVDVGTPPSGAEELEIWDNSDATNWNVGQYMVAFVFSKLNVIPPSSPAVVVPGPPADLSLCRVYGYLETLDNKPAVGVKVYIQLISPPAKSERILSGSSASRTGPKITITTDDQGRITDASGNPWIDLQRNNLLTPAGTTYQVDCSPAGLKKAVMSLAADTFDLATLIS